MHAHLSVPPGRLHVVAAGILAAMLALLSVLTVAPPASAASRGAGFGTWAPLSAHGWHGSMLVNGVHTYCIVPGLPAPTGESVDHGVRGDAAGLSPQQLAGINLLVSTYGQTDDPVQAAAVGWAVKTIANRHASLHAWGYRGDSLAEAVRWAMSRLTPEHVDTIAHLAEQYYAEGSAAAVAAASGTLTITSNEEDPRSGTVRLDAAPSARGTLVLSNAVFADTGSDTRADVAPGVDYPIATAPPAEQAMPYRVSVSGTFDAGFAPAVRYFTTPGQQDTAGPAGRIEFAVEATDDTPRPVTFAPGITTQVAVPEAPGGPFVDDVTLAPVTGIWPQRVDGSHVPLRATAVVYRTDEEPAVSPDVPPDAEPVGELELVTDPAQGGGTYRVTSDWELPGPGYYTAVWTISADAQDPEVARHLDRGYLWAEEFGTPSQTMHVPVPPPAPSPAPGADEETSPEALAVTGPVDDALRLGAGALAGVVLGAALLARLAQRRRLATSASPR